MLVRFPNVKIMPKKITVSTLIILLALIPLTSHSVIYHEDFNQCKLNLAERAQSEGLTSEEIIQVIDGLSPIERVIDLDKRQPEFTQTFEEYINARVTQYHVKTGKEKLKNHKALFDQLEENYGIPRQYLVSFWGLETVFGRHKGKMSVLNSLATLACDERRSEFFTKELINLFTLIDTDKVRVEQLQGSWAGAMGHMQFMPTAFLTYAVDGDGDGHVDIWESEADALTSAANYLQKIGWETKERWGREVQLPEDFDFSKVEFDQYYPLSHFKALGITTINGNDLSNYDIEAELYLPAGYRGPAFMLYPNFNVIMKWNLSKSYAISVGVLANKLIGGKGIQSFSNTSIDNKVDTYRVSEMKLLQEHLNKLGFETGKPDGIWGPQSRNAIRQFQLKHQLVADGFPNKEVFATVNEIISQS